MYKPSRWFVAVSFLLLTAALLAGKSHLLVPVAGSCVVLGYGYAALRRRQVRGTRQHRREQEVMLVEKQRYLLAKEALLDGAKRKRRQLRKQQ